MPPTTVHIAIAGLIACALLDEHFDTRAILIVFAATAILDLDAVLGIYYPGLHRAALHNVWAVLIPLAVLIWDVKLRSNSYVLDRWGEYGFRVGWVTGVAVLFGHILWDAFHNGANLFWPLHDQFYDLSGHLFVSDRQGIVQTFVELGDDGDTVRGTTEDTEYWTAVDPADDPPSMAEDQDPDPDDPPERIAFLAETGEHFLVTVVGFGVVAFRLWQERIEGDGSR